MWLALGLAVEARHPMTRAARLGLCGWFSCWLSALWLWPCSPAFAQARLRVTRTLGDASEVTCSVRSGDASWLGTLGAGVFRTGGSGTGSNRTRFDSTAGLAGNRVRDCALADGAFWVATDAGLSRFDPKQQRFAIVARGRFLALAGSAQVLLAARADGVLLRFERGARHAPLVTRTVASALAISADGTRFALGGIDGRLHVGSGAQLRELELPARAGSRPAPIERLAFERERLQVSTATGHWLIDAAGRVITVAGRGEHAAPALPAASVEHGGLAQCGDRISALQVVGGALWIGSFDRGLCRLDAQQRVTRFAGPKYLPSDMVNALASDGRSLYVATDAGLAIVDPAGDFSQHTHAQCIGQLDARCPWHAAVNGVAVEPGSGAVWVGDIGALHRIDPVTGDWRHPGTRAVLGTQALTRVAARDGEVAIGTSDRGLLLRSASGKRTRAIDDQAGLADNWITDLAYDRGGRLWVATCTRGVSVREPDGRLRHLDTGDGLADDYVLSVQELAGRIWIGTLRGVSVIEGEHVTSLSTADGLSGDEVHDAVLYDGAVWLATDGGLSVVEVRAPVQARVPSGGATPLYSSAPR
jgi:ligand-binding sensor domain-containing protein